jgi:hypothetical protein
LACRLHLPHSYIFGAKDIYSALMKNLLFAVLLLSATTVAAQQSTIKGNDPQLTARMNGQMAKRIKTTGSKGTVRIYSSEIGAGMFIYSLVMDGQTVRSERMVSSNR